MTEKDALFLAYYIFNTLDAYDFKSEVTNQVIGEILDKLNKIKAYEKE